MGQKQLLCLARALLRQNQILVMDEATANVDMETDDFIRECIKTKFSATTVLTIAHRLSTIADYDKILVVSEGRIVESGTPHELIQKKGMFTEMVESTGTNAEVVRRVAEDSAR